MNMLDLIAQGSSADQRWRRPLAGIDYGHPTVIGRSSGVWSVPWDDRISREHAQIYRLGDKLHIERLSTARNPIFFKGQKVESCTVEVGEHFVIGSTTFTLARRPRPAMPDRPADLTRHAFRAQHLRRNPFRDAGARIEVLRRLPDLITSSSSDDELWVRVASVLMQGIPGATAVAVVHSPDGEDSEIEVAHYDSRDPDGSDRAPSSDLVRKTLSTGESMLHLWNNEKAGDLTQGEGIDWAFCVPVGDISAGLGLYVAGDITSLAGRSWSDQSESAADGLQDDLKFAELVATTISNLRDMRTLQRRQAGLQQFFAPVVMNALNDNDKGAEDTLAPREADLSVLFCDLRGFSRQSEKAQDRLLELLERVSESLGVMTRHIRASGGVIGDFHGDAAMGFWGWPLSQQDAPGRASRAAIAILEEFTLAGSDDRRRLANFRCGIGVASGRAVAGRIGTVDQVKVTAFGPVVNLASRLEGMTKQLHAEILVDEVTADFVRAFVPTDVCRIRRLAHVRPAGVATPLIVHQILPPLGPLCSLTDHDIAAYESAFEAVMQRRWEDAFERLHEIPAADRAKDFLTVFIAQHGRVAPADWNGVIDLPKH